MVEDNIPLDDHNKWADFWRYEIGVNVIPADTKNKTTSTSWAEYQEKPIPQEIHNKWKNENSFSKGMAVILGRVWHRKDREGYCLIGIDGDNEKAIKEFCTKNGKTLSLSDFANKTLVEQHKDDPNKAHWYFYSPRPVVKKSSDINSGKMGINEAPAIEVKGDGRHGIMFCTPSPHKNGHKYEIIGTLEPVLLNSQQADELELHIDAICKKYGIRYLDQSGNRTADSKVRIGDLFKTGTKILAGHNRHEALLRVIESLLARNAGILSIDQLEKICREWNTQHCVPPLDDREFEKQWKCAVRFTEQKGVRKEEETCTNMPPTIESLAEEVMVRHHFKTLTDTQDILYYKDGIYHAEGEQVAKIELEKIAGYSTTCHKRREIIEHIKYKTMVRREEFDKDPIILNMQNGLLNIENGQLTEHSPTHLSLVQITTKYDPKATCPNIRRFLGSVLHPQDFFTGLQIIGYCLFNGTTYEKAAMLVGPGSNGKGVFIKIIESLVGLNNTSHVPLQELDNDKFSASDLHGKLVNTFADLGSGTVLSSSMFKTLVSGDTIRAQKKYGQPFNFRNRAKLIFSTNKIPESNDKSYAYYRRWVILCFDKVYEGTIRDPNLIDKLTTAEELSGLLNLALIGLKQLRKDDGFKDMSVERVKEEYDSRANTVKAFLDERCVVDLSAPEFITLTTDVYAEYFKFCGERNERPLESNVFGKRLAEHGIEKERSRYRGDRDYYYIGLKLHSNLRGINQVLSN